MRHLPIVVSVLLNVLFCVALLWFFTHYSYLRPYAGSSAREMLAALLLLTTLYANYFLLYPKIHNNHFILYWVLVVVACLVTSVAELAIAYPGIVKCNPYLIKAVGETRFFSIHCLFVFSRNIAFNFFPFMLRERRQLIETMEKKERIVYREGQMIDVTDHNRNMHLLPKDRIYYCRQDGNYTRFYVTESDCWYTRFGSMKYHEQLLGNKDFIRISATLLLPYQHIVACRGNEVYMERMPWMEEPLVLKIESADSNQITEQISSHLLASKRIMDENESDRAINRRRPISPSKNKKNTVLKYIQKHPGCKSTDISAKTKFSSSTVERSISELKKQGLIEHTGSKKSGGYKAIENEEWRMKT